MSKEKESIFNFILRERFLTVTVLGSIFTFTFISSLKGDIVDPLFHFMFPEDFFGFMNINIREGEKVVMPNKSIDIRLGNFFRELITFMIIICFLYLLAVYTRFPDTLEGNIGGNALM